MPDPKTPTLAEDLYALLKIVKGKQRAMPLGDGSELSRVEAALAAIPHLERGAELLATVNRYAVEGALSERDHFDDDAFADEWKDWCEAERVRKGWV